MTDRQGRVADPVAVDEVARQRQKRSAARRDRLVCGTTIEAAQDETVEARVNVSSGEQRFRTLAQLEALLLKD